MNGPSVPINLLNDLPSRWGSTPCPIYSVPFITRQFEQQRPGYVLDIFPGLPIRSAVKSMICSWFQNYYLKLTNLYNYCIHIDLSPQAFYLLSFQLLLLLPHTHIPEIPFTLRGGGELREGASVGRT